MGGPDLLACLHCVRVELLVAGNDIAVRAPLGREPVCHNPPTCRSARAELMSPFGDPFTLMGVFEEWVRIRERGGRGASTRVRAWYMGIRTGQERAQEVPDIRKEPDL